MLNFHVPKILIGCRVFLKAAADSITAFYPAKLAANFN